MVPTAIPEPWQTLVGVPLRIVVILLVAALARFISHRLIDRYVRNANKRYLDRLKALGAVGGVIASATGYGNARREQRVATAATIVKSTVSFIIVGTALLMILDLLGIPLAPLLASAGVAGLAIGFGAQSLVKDTLSGLFMIVEDQYGVGDVIDAGAATGTVEAVSLRVTRLRDVNGVVWHVRNGTINRIGNESQGWARAVIDFPVSYDQDLPRVRGTMKDTATEMWQEPRWHDVIMEEPEVWGVESVTSDAIVMRLVARTLPLRQWEVARELRERLKTALDEAAVPGEPTASAISAGAAAKAGAQAHAAAGEAHAAAGPADDAMSQAGDPTPTEEPG